MKKLLLSITLCFGLLLTSAVIAQPILAQDDVDLTPTSEYSYEDYLRDTTTQYNYDANYDATTNAVAAWMATFFSGIMLLMTLGIGLMAYVYSSVALMKIAKNLNYEDTWFAWIPILRTVLIFRLGDQNPLLLLLLLIPGIGEAIVFILSIISFMNISERSGYDKVFGLLSLIPAANLILLGILAWGNRNVSNSVSSKDIS